MEEQLKVKIVVDNGDSSSKINKVKDALGQLGDKGKKVTDSISGLKNMLSGIKSEGLSNLVSKIGTLSGGAGEASGMLSNMTSGMKGMGAEAASLGAVIAATVGVIAAFVKLYSAWIKTTIEVSKLGDEIAKTSQKLGMSAKQYQLWNGVMGDCGISTSNFQAAVKKLNINQGNAIQGATAQTQAFNKLGISLDNLKESSSEDLFNNVISKLQQVENQTERNIIANDIFGKSYSELAPLLNLSNAETDQLIRTYQVLGGTMSDRCARASEQLQDALAHLRYAFQGIKNTLAESLMPYITKFIEAITVVVAKISILIKAIFGVELSTTKITSTSGSSSGFKGYTNNVNEATKAVEKLKRSQQGFDELNVVKNPVSASSSPSSGSDMGDIYSGGGSGSLGLLSQESIDKIENFQKGVEKVAGVLRTVVPIATTVLGIALAICGCCSGNLALAAAGIGLASLGITIGASNGTWADIWQGIKDTAVKAWQGISTWFTTKVAPKFTKAYWEEKFAPIKEKLSEKLEAAKAKVIEIWNNIKDWFNDKVAPKFTKAYWQDKFETIREKLSEKLNAAKDKIIEIWNKIKEWFTENVAPKFTKAYWQEKFDTIREKLNEKLESAKETIKDKWKLVQDWYNENIAPKFTKEYWQEKFDSIKSSISGKLQDAIDTVKNKWETIKGWFNENVKPKFTLTYWKDKFDTIKSGIKSSLNGVISSVESAVNNIVTKINKVRFTTPDWIPIIGGKSFGFSLPKVSIPRLAKGGIVDNATTFIAGEAGKEAVIPLENNMEWLDKLADVLAQKVNTPTKVILKVNEKELGYAVINSINGITKQTGSLKLNLI